MHARKAITGILVNVCRLVISLTFIFSGYVKAIDPLGTQYKLQDYLNVVQLSQYVPDYLTLGASVLLGGLEFCLGVFILFAIHRRLMSRLVLLFMAIMTPLTLWLAVANPIKDCGCFGDAIILTNWETFYKNVVLLAAAIVLCVKPLMMPRFISRTNQWIVITYTIIFILFSSTRSLYTLPQFDFRPYHIGAGIKKGMEIPEGAKGPEFETTFILEKNGQRKEFTLENYPDSTWTFIDSKTVQISEGYVPPIHDFFIQTTDGSEDLTDSVLSRRGYTFLLISPHLEYADDSNFGEIDQIYEYCQSHGYPFYGLTASTDEGIQHWRDITGAEYPFYLTDETTLKTVIRSNPGLLLLKDGVVIGKWSHNDLPQLSYQTGKLETTEYGHLPEDSVTGKISKILLWYILPLLLLTFADRTWKFTQWLKEKEHSNRIYQLFKRKKNEKENCSR